MEVLVELFEARGEAGSALEAMGVSAASLRTFVDYLALRRLFPSTDHGLDMLHATHLPTPDLVKAVKLARELAFEDRWHIIHQLRHISPDDAEDFFLDAQNNDVRRAGIPPGDHVQRAFAVLERSFNPTKKAFDMILRSPWPPQDRGRLLALLSKAVPEVSILLVGYLRQLLYPPPPMTREQACDLFFGMTSELGLRPIDFVPRLLSGAVWPGDMPIQVWDLLTGQRPGPADMYRLVEDLIFGAPCCEKAERFVRETAELPWGKAVHGWAWAVVPQRQRELAAMLGAVPGARERLDWLMREYRTPVPDWLRDPRATYRQ